MPMVSFAARKQPKLGNDVKALIQKFIEKLAESDETSGLHIEPIHHSTDPRVRTGRVDKFWRAVLFRVDPPGGETHYIYVGTWPHDDAIEMARKLTLSVNPLNGVLELREAVVSGEKPMDGTTAAHGGGEGTSNSDASAPTPGSGPDASASQRSPLLASLSYLVTDLTNDFGFDASVAEHAFTITSEDDLLEFASSLETPWQQEVLVSMAANEALHLVKERLGLALAEPIDDEDERIVRALEHPASRMQFAPIRGAEELRRIIEDDDFGAWRVFLHPEQRAYVDRDYNGSFRLSGGAGTGKTVVLLHRARRLARENPRARIVLTTFTRALADNLRRDLDRLDPSVPLATALGKPGVLIRGIDQLAAEVRALAGAAYGEAAREVIGSARETTATPREIRWADAATQVGAPAALSAESFLNDEYAQVILPSHIRDGATYFRVRRPGRGVALDRGKRTRVWEIVEQMRRDQRLLGNLSFGEIAAISAHWLNRSSLTLADHVLVDEGQDLEPVKWQLIRALVAEGPNDLFICDDAHQRIYGRATVLKRFGIKIQGRSRRLTLNYRTTLENLRFALGVLEGETFTDLEEENTTTTEGYRSARSGPVPVEIAASSDAEQLDRVAAVVRGWLDESVRGETIALLTLTRQGTMRLQEQLAIRGVSLTPLKQGQVTGDKPVALTMHAAKGLEFSRVVLYDISADTYPPVNAYSGVADEDRDDIRRTFRALVYVAASRARDELVISWRGARSMVLGS